MICLVLQSMPSRDINAATRLAEASLRRDKIFCYVCVILLAVMSHLVPFP